MIKTFKTLDEQIKILQGKGLIISDPEETKDILLRENYFFVTNFKLSIYIFLICYFVSCLSLCMIGVNTK